MATLNLLRSNSSIWLSIATPKCFFRPNFGVSLLGSPKVQQKKSNNIDVLDIFTTEYLLKKKSTVSETTPKIQPNVVMDLDKERSQILREIATKQRTDQLINIEKLSKPEIDSYITIILDCNDTKSFHDVFEQIIQLKKLPSDANIIRILCFMCDDSACSMDKITRLVDVCQEMNIEFYVRSMDFAPFLAQCLWKMNRFDDALSTLSEIYLTSNQTVKSSVLRNYRQIIFDAVRNHDEEVVDKLIQSAKFIYERQKSPIISVYVWADCFYSELFRNQEKANEMFEMFETIRKIVSVDIGWIVLSLVQQHNINELQRLIEQCLKFKMNEECGTCMRALFDYHYSRRDTRSCSEVKKTSLRLGVSFSYEQDCKLLQLEKKQPKQTKEPHKSNSSYKRFEFKF